MRYYVIINGVNSLTIEGLAIRTLPPISKPAMRNLREEIDGRDGDITTDLGYGAYDKTLEIGLFGIFDIDEVIAYFNQKGTITFSNEADKVYYFQALEQVDYAELLKFRTANVVLHCQPFKYPTEEEPLVAQYQLVTNTGSDMSLNNTANALFRKFDLKGNTSQVQTIGKNLVPFTNQDFTLKNVRYYVQDGSLYLNGTSTGETSSVSQEFKDNLSFTLPAGTYYASCGSGGRSYYLYNKTTNTTIFSNPNYVSVGTTRSFTLTEETTLYIGFYVYQNTFNNVNNEIMISTSSGSYEPYTYGATPNPNYPQDIHVVSGDNVVEITGRNTFNLRDGIYSNNGMTAVVNNGEISLTGATSVNAFITIPLDTEIEWEIGKTYSIGAFNPTGNANVRLRVNMGGGKDTNCQNINATNTIAYTTTIDDIYTDRIQIRVQAGTTITTPFIMKPMRIVGSTLGDYEPYTGQTYPLSLGNLEMASIPNTDYKDIFVKEGETWYKREAVRKIILDGSGGSFTYNSGINSIRYNDIDDNLIDNQLITTISNYFTSVSFANRTATTTPRIYFENKYLQFRDSGFGDVASFKTWLTTHNTEVRYILAEAEDIEVSETLSEQLEAIKNAVSYSGQTNVSQTNTDMPFILDLSALKEGSDHLVINNSGNIYAMPTMDIEGTGVVDIYLNDVQILEADLTETNNIVIDTEAMEAYNPDTNALANRQITGDYSKIKLEPGENDLRFSGDLSKATITNYKRWL